jgi:hypothetical protein
MAAQRKGLDDIVTSAGKQLIAGMILRPAVQNQSATTPDLRKYRQRIKKEFYGCCPERSR